MKLHYLLVAGLTYSALLSANPVQASDKMLIEETGHVNFAQNGKSQRQVASATTIITKIFRNTAIVDVSQSFANDTKETIQGEYFFPLPYNSHLLNFELSTDYQVNNEIPDTTVTLVENDQLSVSYQYKLVDDSPYHASVMGFPAKQNLLMQESRSEQELIAKK